MEKILKFSKEGLPPTSLCLIHVVPQLTLEASFVHLTNTVTQHRFSFPKMSFLVKVHPFTSKVEHSCAYELFPSTSSTTTPRNALVFIGGLGDGPQTVPYIRTVAQAIQDNSELSFTVFETRLRSSFTNFGRSTLKDDVEDIAALVKYLRSIGKAKIVLMGHSTGSQV